MAWLYNGEKMILRRLGNKSRIASNISQHFPGHKIYIDPFFGAGGMFFNKPKAKYNIVNDLDSDVFNLFQMVMNRKKELEEAFYIMPIHSDLLNHWKKNEEKDPILKAVRFLLLSNFGYMGRSDCLRFGVKNEKPIFYKNLESTFKLLEEVQFNNCDFRKFFDSIALRDNEIKDAFAYLDPPYFETEQRYKYKFKKKDTIDLFNKVEKFGTKFALSEFNNPFILDQAKMRNLNVIVIGERQNLKNRRIEILITNYRLNQKEFKFH